MARMEDEHAKAWQVFEKNSVEARGQLSVQLAWARPAVFGIEELGNRLKGTEDAIDKYFQATKKYRRIEKLWRKQKKRAAGAREQIAAIATEQEKKAADERAAVAATAASPPDDKRKENGKRKRSGEDDEARSVSKKTRKGAEEQNRGLVTAEKQEQDESGATRRSARLVSGKTGKAASRS
ncbi:hypothetical protein BB8028_0003g15750 [Beauveria bassiana]|uniref:Uncharacterized protein n=1 Tax=Beauveria bassiana TaxID=176275 RepID=A0A2S7Y9V7_BEABA|nr:hypothetical protein BB8028_0003g15750 [Beauveria bassiana]